MVCKNIAVTFQPFGEQIRHVKCDDAENGAIERVIECELRDMKSTSDELRQCREDPLTRMRLLKGEKKIDLIKV